MAHTVANHTVVVVTDHSVTWECLRRFAAPGGIRLERVNRLEDLAGREGLAVDAVVVDDRFLSIIDSVERSARRHSPVFQQTVFMTAGEALNALWHGPLGAAHGCSTVELALWVNEIREGEPA